VRKIEHLFNLLRGDRAAAYDEDFLSVEFEKCGKIVHRRIIPKNGIINRLSEHEEAI